MLFSLFAYAGQACSCIAISDYFCPTVSWVNANGNPLNVYVAQVKVASVYGYYMDVQVVENLQNALPVPEITILGQDGLNCNEWIGHFEPGKSYVLAINESGWQEGVYDLSGCGLFWLPVIDGQVQGNIAEDIQEQSYEAFRQGFAQCAAITSTEEPGLAALRLFPNPTSGELYVGGLEAGTSVDYALYSLTGQILQAGKFHNGASPSLSLQGLPAGVYVLRLQAGKAVLSRRVLVAR